MSFYDMIKVFKDTQRYIKSNPDLHKQMTESRKNSELFCKGYISPVRKKKGTGEIEIVESTTFQCARELHPQFSKIAVLNFANPFEPGGGVRRGAMAQEECLCRCSDLYNALAQPYFIKNYYLYHLVRVTYNFSDRLIYSPNVTVIKSDDKIPQLLDIPFFVDVITCAAPCLMIKKKANDKLMAIYKSRIRNILEVAIAKDVDCLVLGAFGCGAFRNSPYSMAKAFSDVLIGEEYAKYFEKVVFAIKRTGDFCENLCAFETAFYGTSAERNVQNVG